MKKGSKLLAILLTLVLVLSVCGCGGSDESGKQLIGTWALEYDLADLLAERWRASKTSAPRW